MLLKPTLAAMALAAGATVAAPAHAVVDVPVCTATAPAGHTRAYCTFVGPPGTYKVTIRSSAVRYSFARVTCQFGTTPAGPMGPGVWDTEGGYAEETGPLGGGLCTLEVAAGASTVSTGLGSATGTVYYVV